MMFEDLAAYGDVLGQDVETDAGTIRGVFDANPSGVLGAVDQADPTISVAVADWPSLARGASCTIGGAGYRVIGIEPDGTGWAAVRLALA